MKDTILILAALLGLGSAIYSETVKLPALQSALSERNASHQALSDDYQTAANLTKKQQTEIDLLLAERSQSATRRDPEDSTPAPGTTTTNNNRATAPAADHADPRATLAATLQRLADQYDAHRARLDAQSETLRQNEATARNNRAEVSANPPSFQEQTVRYRPDGSKVIGGVRTSDADRQPIIEAHRAKLAALDAYLSEVHAAQAQLARDYQTLEDNYRAAQDNARATSR